MKILTLCILMLMTCQAESHNMTVEAQAQNEVQLTLSQARAKRSSQAATTPPTADEQPFCEILDSTKLNLGMNDISQNNVDYEVILSVLVNSLELLRETGVQVYDTEYLRAFGEGAFSSCWLQGSTVALNAFSESHQEVVLTTTEEFYLLNMLIIKHHSTIKSLVLGSGVYIDTATKF